MSINKNKKKFLLGSLAMLIACTSGAVAADSLEEAIKGVKVGGFIRYRINSIRFSNLDFEDGKNATGNGGVGDAGKGAVHNFRTNVDFTSPAVGGVSANLGLMYSASNTTNKGGYPGSGLGTGYDGRFGVSTFFFDVALPQTNTHILAGKMRIDSPFHDTTDDRVTGALVTSTDIQGVNLFAGAFDTYSVAMGEFEDTLQGSNSITKSYYTLGASADIQGFNAKAVYANVTDLYNTLAFLSAGYSHPMFHAQVQYGMSSLGTTMLESFGVDPNTIHAKTHSLLTLEVGTKVSLVDAKVGYIMSMGDGYQVSLDSQGEYSMSGQIWNDGGSITGISYNPLDGGVNPFNKQKLSVVHGAVGLNFLNNDALRVSLDYVNGKKEDTTINETISFQEITPMVTYNYTKNLSMYVYYAMLTAKKDPAVATTKYADSQQNKLRTQVIYKF